MKSRLARPPGWATWKWRQSATARLILGALFGLGAGILLWPLQPNDIELVVLGTAVLAGAVAFALPDSPRLALPPRLVAVVLVLLWAAILAFSHAGHDALTYLAAGERLNAGHALYALVPGDRPVEIMPPFYGPLLSPPLIAVVFRPIAALGMPAMWAWTAALAFIMVEIVRRLVRTRWDALLVVVLAIGFAMATIAGNVSNLFLVAYVALWRWQDRPIVGALVGVMGVAKLVPFVFVGFLVAGRRWRSLGWCAVGAVAGLAVTFAGAG